MREEKLFELFGQIDEKYIDEARQESKRKKVINIKWLSVAACFAFVVLGVGTLLFNFNKPETPIESNKSAVSIKLDNVLFNKITTAKNTDMDLKEDYRVDYKEVEWSKEKIKEYFGKDLTPPYIPKGLKASPENDNTTVVLDKDGNIVMDEIGLGFYDDYYKDGSPKLSKNVAAEYGFSLSASKIGITDDCFALDISTQTDIKGTKVTFDYCTIDYGPYDEKTHEPAGYYDAYYAEFKCDGIYYKVTTDQLDKTEIVKIVTSIITGEKNIVVK